MKYGSRREVLLVQDTKWRFHLPCYRLEVVSRVAFESVERRMDSPMSFKRLL